MSLSQSPFSKSGVAATLPHLHITGDACPLCDQPIPRDRYDEIKGRIESRQSANEAALTERLQDQFVQQIADAREQERGLATEQLEAGVAAARREERFLAEAAAKLKLVEAERAMQSRLEDAERAKGAAEELHAAIQAQLDEVRRESEAAIQKVLLEAEANARLIRDESNRQAEANVLTRVAELQHQHSESTSTLRARLDEAEVARSDAQRASADLLARIERAQRDHDAAVEKMRQEGEANAAVIREDAKRQARSEERRVGKECQ